MMADDTRDGWRSRAACIGTPTEWWFPERGDRSPKAVAVCYSCPVASACLDDALAVPARDDLAGIRAGTGAHARKRIRAARNRTR